MLECMLSLRLTACNIRYACRGCLEIIIVTAFLELPWHPRMHFRWLLQRGDFRYFFLQLLLFKCKRYIHFHDYRSLIILKTLPIERDKESRNLPRLHI